MATQKLTNGAAVIQAIIRANYAATEDQVEQLAHVVVTGDQADVCYFRVILAHMQARLGKGRRPAKAIPQEPVLDAVHEQMYAAALRGVGPEEMDQDERNRLGIKFRTAASTVRFAIRAGVDIRAVDVATATKNGLRRMAQPEGVPVPEGASRALRGYIKAAEGIKNAITRLARGDPDRAKTEVEQLMDDLERLLNELDKPPAEAQAPADVGGQTTTIVGKAGTRGGVPAAGAMLHRPA